MANYYPAGRNLFLKIDVQGYESRVLEGAQHSIDRVVGLVIEMSVLRCYEGERLLWEMLPHLYSLGFRLIEISKGWHNAATGEAYQVNGTFFRTDRCQADSVA